MDDHPELDGYEPFETRPLRSRWTRRAIQAAALLGVLLLLMPFFFSQQRVASLAADKWCAAWVRYEVPEPSTPHASFQLFGPSVIGWECYATHMIGGDRYIGSLGIIPGPPVLDDHTGQVT
jgi:hypothetical protein